METRKWKLRKYNPEREIHPNFFTIGFQMTNIT